MALLKLENGKTLTSVADIEHELSGLAIRLNVWPTGSHPELVAMLSKPALAAEEKDQVLAHLDHYFKKLQAELGYQTRDLIVLHREVPNVDELLAKFEKPHRHDDDEVRYIIDGQGVFGFVRPDGSQVELRVEAGEFINVPAETEHWFYMTAEKRIKAVRYFTGTQGWTPRYTNATIRMTRMA